MENTSYSTSTFRSVVPIMAIIAAVIIVILALLRVDTYMKYQAINDCGKISTFEQSLSNAIKVSYPVQDIYNECLKKKGI